MTRYTLALALMLAAAAPGLAQDEYRHGRVRHVEQGALLQRADETAAEDALPNMPFLPGDRIWTDDRGRAEFQFADGSVLRLDSRSKLDYVAHEEGRDLETLVLRLWSGSVFVHDRDDRGGNAFAIETPGGVVEIRGRGSYRVDTQQGEVRLSVYDGRATLDSGRRAVTVDAGERSYARRGEDPEEPRGFDRAEDDDFARWDAEREDGEARQAASRRYLPEEVSPYAAEFDAYGAWYHQGDVGYVWRPYVDVGWRPYWDGHWGWTPYGWTWVPNEPWGWAVSHYGRWGHSPALGWYWVPGRHWSPAWVSWAVGGDWVGWCPLGYRDRPVVVPHHRGNAVPRGTLAVEAERGAWVYARQGDLRARDLARRRTDMTPADARTLRIIDGTRARLGRDLREVSAEAAVPRNVSRRPSPGDTNPELRTDPATTIPHPIARRRPRPAEEGDPARAEPVRYERRSGSGDASGNAGGQNERAARPRSFTERPETGSEPARQPRGDSASPGAQRPGEDNGHEGDGGRDVLRRFFRPLGGARPRPQGEQAGPASGSGAERGVGAQPAGDRSGQGRPPDAHAPRPRNDGGSASGAAARSREGGRSRSEGAARGGEGARPREGGGSGEGRAPRPKDKDQ